MMIVWLKKLTCLNLSSWQKKLPYMYKERRRCEGSALARANIETNTETTTETSVTEESGFLPLVWWQYLQLYCLQLCIYCLFYNQGQGRVHRAPAVVRRPTTEPKSTSSSTIGSLLSAGSASPHQKRLNPGASGRSFVDGDRRLVVDSVECLSLDL